MEKKHNVHTLAGEKSDELIDKTLFGKEVLVVLEQPAMKHESWHDERSCRILIHVSDLCQPALINVVPSSKVHLLLNSIDCQSHNGHGRTQSDKTSLSTQSHMGGTFDLVPHGRHVGELGSEDLGHVIPV